MGLVVAKVYVSDFLQYLHILCVFYLGLKNTVTQMFISGGGSHHANIIPCWPQRFRLHLRLLLVGFWQTRCSKGVLGNYRFYLIYLFIFLLFQALVL